MPPRSPSLGRSHCPSFPAIFSFFPHPGVPPRVPPLQRPILEGDAPGPHFLLASSWGGRSRRTAAGSKRRRGGGRDGGRASRLAAPLAGGASTVSNQACERDTCHNCSVLDSQSSLPIPCLAALPVPPRPRHVDRRWASDSCSSRRRRTAARGGENCEAGEAC